MNATDEPITAATAYKLPQPKGYLCAAGCGHSTHVHREAGCDVVVSGNAPCDCYAPFGRILPSAEATR